MARDIDTLERVTVQIPDMFVSFLAEPPRFNPNYKQVKAKSDAWISECVFPLVHPAEVPGFSQTVFDNGELRDKPTAAAVVMQSLMSPMIDCCWQEANISGGERLPIVKVHDTVWRRLQRDSSKGIQRRFSKAMADYCAGALMHVEDLSAHKIPPTPDEMLKMRQLSAGVSPLFSLVEYAHALRIPDHVFDHPVIQEIEQLGIDFVLITNDILSYMKEEGESVPHNLVAVARMSGLQAQEAFDYIGNMLNSRYERWEKALGEMPYWGEEINKHAERYVRGVADVVRANLYWR
ncbi:hypothetical protein GQX73_g9998 [Xylaria multiplex]|uniref:Terpene synthase n=1 Tax=Xylaria multiplex TaxID=323545 RepID=A0A7C8MN20_9PEZI|nr:hypothetical protein GQX73_g9998 [Xylaria multiplex]